MMTTDIFLRSYSGDILWVPYALRSLQKFVTGIRDIIVCVPGKDIAQFSALHFTREKLVPSWFPDVEGYMDQMRDKLLSFLHTDADAILFWDSDVIAIRPFSPADLLIDGKPRWIVTPYSKLIKADGTPDVPWRPITEKAIGRSVEVETMRMHPLMATCQALESFHEFMVKKHGKPLGEYIAEQPYREFSEFNACGAWAFYYAPHLFSWWNTEEKGVPEPFVLQKWSYGGITPEIRAEFERILA